MIQPFIQVNNIRIITNRVISVLNPTIDYLESIGMDIPFNLVFGRIKQYEGELTFDALVKVNPTYRYIANRLDYIYYESIEDINYKFLIILDIEQMYAVCTDNEFDRYVQSVFLHEYRHIYQIVNKMYEDMKRASTLKYKVDDYLKIPWEVDADEFADTHVHNIPITPFYD